MWDQIFIGYVKKFFSTVLPLICFLIGEGGAYAQTPPITSSGLDTQVSAPVVPPGGPVQHNITGGTRPNGGANLFHSFREFGVPDNHIANFLNDSNLSTVNILSRVTGGNPSNILGTIQTEGFGNANLFLVNPAGIVFGPNASLNVGGATHFTTADYLRLADGVQFTAIPGTQDALLSVAPVASFGFLGDNPSAISVNGSTLSVVKGQTLSLVGGDITIGSGLNAPGGKINLVSVASPGEVLAETFANAENVNGQSFATMGNISLTDGSTLNVSADAAGTVIIRGGELMMTNATISADTVSTPTTPLGIDIDVVGKMSIFSDSDPALTARATGGGNAGKIQINSGGLEAVSNFPGQTAIIDSHTSGIGKGGDVDIITEGDIKLIGNIDASDLFILTGTAGPGAGGNVNINGGNVFLESAVVNTADIEAFVSSGPGGDITIMSANQVTLNESGNLATDSFLEKGGSITLRAPNIQILNSRVTAVSFLGGNTIELTGDNLVLLQNSNILNDTAIGQGGGVTITGSAVEFRSGRASGANITTQTFGDGNAGSVLITASDRVLFIDDPTTSVPSGLFTSSFGGLGLGDLGNAGNVVIRAPRVEIAGGARINTTTQSGGRGGDVLITATEKISATGERDNEVPGEIFDLGGTRASGIYTRTVGSEFCGGGPCGDAGNISITTGVLDLTDGAVIDSGTTSTGTGGSISVKGAGIITIAGNLKDGSPGGVFSRTIGSGLDSGQAGDISLETGQNFTLSDRATVSSSSSGPGNAGAIAIKSGSFTMDQGAVVDSGTTSTGTGGEINVTATDTISMSGLSVGVFSQTTGTEAGAGAGGTISLAAGQNFILSDGARVSARSSGPGNAGNINITGHDTIMMDQASVITEAAKASGGEIKLTANDTIQLVDSNIESTVKGDSKTVAGNIELDPDFIILQNSHILAKAVDGQGGNITLIASKGVLVDAQSTLEVTSERGISGTVNIESPIQVLSGTIVPLPDQPVNVATLYASRCVAGEGGHFSTFVDSKSDSVAPTPGTFLASPLMLPSVQAKADNSVSQKSPIMLTASIAPLVLGHAGEFTTACP